MQKVMTDVAAMQSVLGSEHQKSGDSGSSAPCALWPVDLKLTHLHWNPEATLIHFQGQYLTICELDYSSLQREIQSTPKTKAAVDIGELCLVEDTASAHWYRGRVQNRKDDLFDVFLIDLGIILTVDIVHISSCSNDLFTLPPKIVCGFLANVLLLQGCSHSAAGEYFLSLIGKDITGYIQALLPHKVLLLEVPDISNDLVRHGFAKHLDTNTFLLLAEMLTEVPLKHNTEPVPDLLIEKPRGQEFSFKPSSLQGYEDILEFCGPRLSCGTRAIVRVTAAVNPGLFHCQMASMEAELGEMSKKLAAVCEDRTKACSQKPPENLGLLCAVKGKNEKWYRGIVQFLPISSHVRVLFIDSGFFESVKVENIYRLPSHFYSIPIMAFPCSLSSLSDQDEAVKSQQLSFLKAGLLGEMVNIEICSFDKEHHLYCIQLIGVEDNHVKEPAPIRELPRNKVQSVFDTKELSPHGGYLYYETIMDEAFCKTLEAEGVAVGSIFVGYVVHVQNPAHFWITTQKRKDEFEEMMTELADHFSQVRLDEDVLLNPERGMLCCALYEKDMHYYRGVVIDTLDHGAGVLFIDFGNIEKVPYMLIKNIPEAFASKSAFAFCCTLANVFPVDEDWTSSSSDFFRQAVSNKALQVHVVQRKKNKFVVGLCEMGSENNQSITDFLISSNEAQWWNNSHRDHVVKNNTGVTGKTKSPRYSVTSHIGGNTDQCGDWEEEENTSKNEFKETQSSVSFKSLCIKPGCEFAVQCSHINSPSDFWCQPQNNGPVLEKMMERLQEYYSVNTVPLQSEVPCCVAKSPLDGRWYRAVITEKQKSHVIVMLVDYGLTVQVKESNLQAIVPEHLHLEQQAFRCTFSNLVEPTDSMNCGEWSPEICNIMKKIVLDSTTGLKCKVVSQLSVKNKGLCSVVNLYNTQTQQSITDFLVKKGLARETRISTKQLPTVSPQSFVYSAFDLSPGHEEQVYVTHVSSQWEVYCHLDRNTEIIEELENRILEEREEMMQDSTRDVVKKLCLAKYFDGKWYRGVAHPVQSPLHLSVFFVDYGNTNISEKNNIVFIPRDSADLLYTPMQAVRCHLASVPKEALYVDVKEWLERAVLNKQVKAAITGQCEDGSFDVELFDGDVNINEKIKEFILSLSSTPKPVVDLSSKGRRPKILQTRSCKTSMNCKSQLKGLASIFPKSNPHIREVGNACQKKKRYIKNYIHREAQSKNIKVKQQNQEKTKTCVQVKPWKNSQVKQQKDLSDKDTNTKQPRHIDTTDTPQLSCLPDRKVSAGLRAKCFVSHVNSLNSFFLHLSEDEPAILKMVEDLNTPVIRNSLRAAKSLRFSHLILAEYEDGALYRGVVRGWEGSSCFNVEFVDYGNTAATGKENIFSIPNEYLSQPRFSIPCSLLDRSIYENDASFTIAVMEKPLMVDFVHQYATHWEVNIEVIDEAASVLENSVESSSVNEKEETTTSSHEIEEKARSCEQDYPRIEMSKSETVTSEGTIPTVKSENIMPAVTLPTKEKVKTYWYHRRLTTSKNVSKRMQKKRSTSSIKAKRNCANNASMPLTIQARDTENGTVLSVLSNGKFYVRLARTSHWLDALEAHIADNLHKCEMVNEEDVKQDLKCLVQVHTNSKWHRAVVKSVCMSEERCKVFLVDHGITEEIPHGSIRRQYRSLTKVPNFAVLCKMNCFGWSERENVSKSWCETLKPVIGREVTVVFVCVSEDNKLWMVEIVMNGLFLTCPTTASPQESEKMIPLFTETKTGSGEKEPSFASSPPQQLAFAPIDMDKAYYGFAAAVTTPFELHIVLEDLFLIMNKVSIMLSDLPEQLSPLPEVHLVQGTCCLFKSGSENKWCRSEIEHIDTNVVLHLVDYGHYECMPYKDHSKLKRLPEELVKLPKLTYPCILRGVKPVGGDGQWTDEAAIFFQQFLYQKNLQIFFRELMPNSHWKVDVLADGVHVAKELVDAGHASFIDIVLGFRFQKQIASTAPPQDPDSEEEFFQEAEGSDVKSSLAADDTEEAERKMPPTSLSGYRQCSLM